MKRNYQTFSRMKNSVNSYRTRFTYQNSKLKHPHTFVDRFSALIATRCAVARKSSTAGQVRQDCDGRFLGGPGHAASGWKPFSSIAGLAFQHRDNSFFYQWTFLTFHESSYFRMWNVQTAISPLGVGDPLYRSDIFRWQSSKRLKQPDCFLPVSAIF